MGPVIRTRLAGFTLLEMLAVIAIIAVLAGATMLSLGGDMAHRTQAEAERLAVTLQLAADEALFQNTEIGLSVGKNAYVFLQYDVQLRRWHRLESHVFRSHVLPNGLHFSLMLEQEPVTLPMSAVADKASILFLSSGEVTPFVLTVIPEAGEAIRIGTDGVAPVAFLPGGST